MFDLFDDRLKVGAHLPAPWEGKTELKPDDFNDEFPRNRGTLAVLFLASWCLFCKRFLPVFQAAAEKAGIAWAPMDISDDSNPLWEIFSIRVVPTIIIFKEGKAVFRRDGILGRGLSEKAIDDTMDQMMLLSTTT
jgi:thioredoxin